MSKRTLAVSAKQIIFVTFAVTWALCTPHVHASEANPCESLLTTKEETAIVTAYARLLERWIENRNKPLSREEFDGLKQSPTPVNPIGASVTAADSTFKQGFEKVLAKVKPELWPTILNAIEQLYLTATTEQQQLADAVRKQAYALIPEKVLELKLPRTSTPRKFDEVFDSLFIDENEIFLSSRKGDFGFNIYRFSVATGLQKIATRDNRDKYYFGTNPPHWVRVADSIYIRQHDDGYDVEVLELKKRNDRLLGKSSYKESISTDPRFPWMVTEKGLFHTVQVDSPVTKGNMQSLLDRHAYLIEYSLHGTYRGSTKIAPEAEDVRVLATLQAQDKHYIAVVARKVDHTKLYLYELSADGKLEVRQTFDGKFAYNSQVRLVFNDGTFYLSHLPGDNFNIYSGSAPGELIKTDTHDMSSAAYKNATWIETQTQLLALVPTYNHTINVFKSLPGGTFHYQQVIKTPGALISNPAFTVDGEDTLLAIQTSDNVIGIFHSLGGGEFRLIEYVPLKKGQYTNRLYWVTLNDEKHLMALNDGVMTIFRVKQEFNSNLKSTPNL